MKVLIYLAHSKSLANSGIGRAQYHQAKALELAGVDYTFDKKDSFDIEHINSYGFLSYLLLRKCKRKGIPVIVHGHSTHEDFKESFRFWKLMAHKYNSLMDRMYRNADLIITPTQYSKNLIGNYRNINCEIKAISNGINLDNYTENIDNIKLFEDKFGIKKEDKIVISIGFYFKRKGLHDFMEVARKMPNIKFIWFGDLNKIYTTPFILKVIKNKPENVILPGYIKGKIVNGAMHRASAMFFPTYEETEGIVVLESLASKLPLITRDIGVYGDWLTNGVNCYKGKNNDEFVSLITKVLNNDNRALVDNGYEVAKNRSIDLVGSALKEEYIKLINKN